MLSQSLRTRFFEGFSPNIHRDIKPSNIMVRLKDDGGIAVKIIDLGLAKAITEPSYQTAISTASA